MNRFLLPLTAIFTLLITLISCMDELRISNPSVMELSGPLSFRGTHTILYDTLNAVEGTPYKINVTFHGEGNDTLTPGLTFSGSGRGTQTSELKLNSPQQIIYYPAQEGQHPIYLYFWNKELADDCLFLPKEKVMILLTVIHKTSPIH